MYLRGHQRIVVTVTIIVIGWIDLCIAACLTVLLYTFPIPIVGQRFPSNLLSGDRWKPGFDCKQGYQAMCGGV